MTWKEFELERAQYKKVWEEMKSSYKGEIHSYLDKTKVMVSAGRAFGIDDNIDDAFLSCPAFFLSEMVDENASVTDAWRIELRFPYIDIDFIQEIKRSPYCDHDKTLMKPSSCVVVLKRES